MNNIAIDLESKTVHSSIIYNLRKSGNRIESREQQYTCPHCKTVVIYAQQGFEGCFRHLPSTSDNIKQSCPYYQGLLNGAL